jgi:hypothetical protein
VRLGRHAAGVDREDAHPRVDAPGHVEDGYAVGLEARADRQAPGLEARGRPADDFLRTLVVKLDGELARLVVVQQVPIVDLDGHSPHLHTTSHAGAIDGRELHQSARTRTTSVGKIPMLCALSIVGGRYSIYSLALMVPAKS